MEYKRRDPGKRHYDEWPTVFPFRDMYGIAQILLVLEPGG